MEFNATFIAALVSFVVFIAIMNQILYKPIGDIIEKRKKFIDENYSEVKSNSNKKEEILKDRIDKLEVARSVVKEKIAQAGYKAKAVKNQLLLEAKNKAKTDIEENINIYNQQSEEAKNALKQEAIGLAQIIADKFISAPERIENNRDYEILDGIMQG